MSIVSVAGRAMVFAIVVVAASACGELAIAPSGEVADGSAAFSRNREMTPGSPDKNRSCDVAGGAKSKAPNDWNQCDGGGDGGDDAPTGQLWRVTVGNMITGDAVHVCGPRAAGGSPVCLTSDDDFQGMVTTSDSLISTFNYKNFRVAVTEAEPYVTIYPVRADGGSGVGGGGALNEFTPSDAFGVDFSGTVCEAYVGTTVDDFWYERCRSTTEGGGVVYAFGDGPRGR